MLPTPENPSLQDEAQGSTTAGIELAEMCAVLGLSARRVQELTREGVLRRTGRNLYDLPTCVQAYVAYREQVVQGDSESSAIHAQRARLVKAQADKAEAELAVMRGELIPKDEARRIFGRMPDLFRASLLSLPSRLGPELEARPLAEVEAKLDGWARETLTSLSRIDFEAKEEADDEDPETDAA